MTPKLKNQLAIVLALVLARADVIPPHAHWRALTGGRTNGVWRVRFDDQDLICKLYLPGSGNLIFPNNPAAEAACLSHLYAGGLAPQLVATQTTSVGVVLIYKALHGPVWSQNPAPIAGLLYQIHHSQPPAGLPLRCLVASDLMNQGDDLLQMCQGNTGDLEALRPTGLPDISVTPCLIHTDVVATNIIMTSGGPTLIDWQCPALGDPCEDLASFLSPAMQTLYRGKPLSGAERAVFLNTYPDTTVTARFAATEPAYLWRMACYCQWRHQTGHPEYKVAYAAEVGRLKNLKADA